MEEGFRQSRHNTTLTVEQCMLYTNLSLGAAAANCSGFLVISANQPPFLGILYYVVRGKLSDYVRGCFYMELLLAKGLLSTSALHDCSRNIGNDDVQKFPRCTSGA